MYWKSLNVFKSIPWLGQECVHIFNSTFNCTSLWERVWWSWSHSIHVTIYFRVCVCLGVGCCSVCLKLFSCSLQLQRLGCWQVRSPAASHVCLSQCCPLVLIVLQGAVGSAVGVWVYFCERECVCVVAWLCLFLHGWYRHSAGTRGGRYDQTFYCFCWEFNEIWCI